MIDVATYIKLILKKKKWTNKKLLTEINKIETKLGDARTTRQNITNYLNGGHDIRPKWLAKVEVALNLPQGELVSKVALPVSKNGNKELKDVIKKINENRKQV